MPGLIMWDLLNEQLFEEGGIMNTKVLVRVLAIHLIVLFVGGGVLFAQEEFLSPFEMDDQTVLLMHFDENLHNEASFADSGTVNGNLQWFAPPNSEFGNSAYINNSGAGGSEIVVPHYDALNLDSTYTIEGWFLVVNSEIEAEEGQGGWYKRQPHIFAKVDPRDISGDESYDYGLRYYESFFQAEAYFGYGYDGLDDVEEGQRLAGAKGTIELNTWYHFAMIHDMENKADAFMLFDAQGNLVERVLEGNEHAIEYGNYQNNEPLTIGTQDTHDDGNWFDGAVDEFRISNGIRSYYNAYLTPVISDVIHGRIPDTEFASNAFPGEETEVEVKVQQIGDNPAESVEIYYSTDQQNWESTEMQFSKETAGGDLYTANLPAQSSAPEKINYYIKATNANGETYSPRAARTGDSYHGVGVWDRDAQTLDLTFDEGTPGDQVTGPVDYSGYHEEVIADGDNIIYSDDVPAAVDGGSSIALNMDPNRPDTSRVYIEPPTPFINGTDHGNWTYSFWFKLDSALTVDKVPFWQAMSEIGIATCRMQIDGADIRVNVHDHPGKIHWEEGTTLELLMNKWWHFKAGTTPDYAWFEMRDGNDKLVMRKVGELGADRPVGYDDGLVQWGEHEDMARQYHGWFDDIKFWNYPHNIPPTFVGAPSGGPSTAGTPAEISVPLSHPGSEITSAQLHYFLDGSWHTSALSSAEEDMYRGTIPGQPAGTIVEYYLTAEADNGLTTTYPTNAVADTNFLSAAWWEERSETMALTFENGPNGPVTDTTIYNHQFTSGFFGSPDPWYVDNAKFGNYAMAFGEKSLLSVDASSAPFMASSEFTVDMWFRPDSVDDDDGWLANRTWTEDWNDGPWYLRVDDRGDDYVIQAHVNFWEEDGDVDEYGIKLDSALVNGNWYHVIMEAASDDSVFVQLYDTNDDLIEEQGESLAGAELFTGPGRFNLGGGRIESDEIGKLFAGTIDEFHFYNYARTLSEPGTAVEDGSGLPQQISLEQNYPNPFNPTTQIQYSVPKTQEIRLAIYDLLGRQVDVLVDKEVAPGVYTVTWDGTNATGQSVSSGMYFYRLESADRKKVRKMILLR